MAEIWAFIVENALPLLLMLIGFSLLTLEIFLPGFGIPGISGSIMLVAGIALIADSVLEGLLIGLIAVALLGVAFTIALRTCSKGKLFNKKLVLEAVATDRHEENPLAYYLGKTGVSKTSLNPVGSAEIEGARLSVMTDGEFVSAGQSVVVIRVEGKQLYVKKAQ